MPQAQLPERRSNDHDNHFDEITSVKFAGISVSAASQSLSLLGYRAVVHRAQRLSPVGTCRQLRRGTRIGRGGQLDLGSESILMSDASRGGLRQAWPLLEMRHGPSPAQADQIDRTQALVGAAQLLVQSAVRLFLRRVYATGVRVDASTGILPCIVIVPSAARSAA
jgi:hypothetical protein